MSGEEGKATEAAYSQTRKQMIGSTSILVQREEGSREQEAAATTEARLCLGRKRGSAGLAHTQPHSCLSLHPLYHSELEHFTC